MDVRGIAAPGGFLPAAGTDTITQQAPVVAPAGCGQAGLRRWIAAEVAIQEAWYVTGDEDYVLVVSARDVESYEALMSRLLAENANVRRYRTRVVLGTVKRGMAVPLDPP